ncbi:MAG: hypothetical protein DELT_02878 [Desulfovibrio sp.]
MSAAETATTVKGPITGLAADPQTGSAASAAQSAGKALGEAANAIGQNSDLVSWASYFQALAILFLIVALLAVLLWFLKRKGGIKLLTKQGDLALESRLSLGPKKSLVVVRFLNKKVLLGVTDQQITMLTELPNDENNAPHHTNAAEFKDVLDEMESAPK